MQSTTDRVIQQLQNLLEYAKNMESRYLGQILALEKLVNQTQKCIQIIHPKETAKDLPKKQEPKLSVQDKVNALMSEIEARQKIIENQKKQIKPKLEVKLPEIPVEKKPPVPTVNRNEKVLKTLNPAYVPPRNKNQVTGKVTQTTMRTSGQKVFRPQKTSLKKVESKEQVKMSRGSGKQRASMEKKQSKTELIGKRTETISRKEAEISQPPKQIKVEKQPQPTIEEKKASETVAQVKKGLSKVKFASFHKQVEEILSQMFKQGPKNHRNQLQRLLNQCQNQQKGHKMHEDSNRKIFVKKANNYAISRHAVYPMSSFQISRNKWTYHPELADFHLLLQGIENQLANLQLQKDCRIDKKTHFRIAQSSIIYGKTLENIKSNFEQSQNQVPQKLDLNFNFNQQNQVEGETSEEAEWEGLSESYLSSHLLQLQQDIKQRGTLQRSQLRCLQILSEIGVFRSKRAPLLVMDDQYKGWKQHYSNQNI